MVRLRLRQVRIVSIQAKVKAGGKQVWSGFRQKSRQVAGKSGHCKDRS